MSKKITLPGHKGSAMTKVTNWMRAKQVYTKPEVIEQFMKLGKTKLQATYQTVMLLSPRLTSKRGDPCGNLSCTWGELAYNERLAKVPGVKGRKFRFRFRKEPLTRFRARQTVADAKKTPIAKVETKVEEKV